MKIKPNKYYKWQWNISKNTNSYEHRIYFIRTDNIHVYEIGYIRNKKFYNTEIPQYSIKWFNDYVNQSMIILNKISYADVVLEMI